MAATTESIDCTCQKCGRTKKAIDFYTYKDGSKFELCKDCLCMHIDNFDPSTFLWILEKADVPYIPSEWNILRDKAFAKNPNLTGKSVIGKYLSKMKLKQFKSYTWADSERLQEEDIKKQVRNGGYDPRTMSAEELDVLHQQQRILREQLENGEISEAEYKTLMPTEIQYQEAPVVSDVADAALNPFREDQLAIDMDLPNPADQLTEEDKIYLAMKWGTLYRPSEWVALEKNYNDMMQSFDIKDADSLRTLLLICKTDLKMNQAIDSGDYDGYNKLSRVNDQLRKSAKFTAAQNKEGQKDFVDSVGELVAYCEKEGGQIPRFEIDTPYDIVDKIIQDLKDYTKSLVYEDKSLAQEIETYLKKMSIAEEMKKDKQKAREKGVELTLSEQDFKDFSDSIIKDKEKDKEIYKEGQK